MRVRPGRFQGCSIAFVYCSATGQSQTSTCANVLTTVIRQLAEVKGEVGLVQPIVDLHAKHVHTTQRLPEMSIQEQREVLTSIFSLGIKTYIVIDGLDELGEDGAYQALEVLSDASRQHSGSLRLFLTGREGVNVIDHFPEAVKIYLTPELTKADMEEFVYGEVWLRKNRLLRGKRSDLETRLETALLNKAGGM